MTPKTPQPLLDAAVAALRKHGNKSAAARSLKIARTTLISRLDEADRRKAAGPSAAKTVEPSSNEYDVKISRRMTLLQDENNRLRKALKTAEREANTEDILRDVIGKVATAPTGEPAWTREQPERKRGNPTPEAAAMLLADWHNGEVVEPDEVNGFNKYDVETAHDRAERAVEAGIKLARKHMGGAPAAGMIAALVGDFVSGGLHPELKATDQEEAISATIITRGWLRSTIARFAGEFGRVYVPCVAGNHGRNTAKPEFKRYYKKNFDWLLYKLLQDDFQDDPRVTIDVRPSNDVFFRVFGQRYLLQHGDMLGVKGGDGIIGAIGPIMRGAVKKSGQSTALGFGFDKLLIGHWHQRLWLPRATVGNTLKGFDEYAKNQLGATPDRPSQSMWFIHPSHGETSHWDVYVDDKPELAREWVAVMGAA